MVSRTTIWQVSSLCYPPQNTESEPFVTTGLPGELKFLSSTFKHNGYNKRILNLPEEEQMHRQHLTFVAFFPFIGLTFNCTSRMLSKHTTKTAGLPPRKVASFLRFVKDDLGLRTFGVHSTTYIGKITFH